MNYPCERCHKTAHLKPIVPHMLLVCDECFIRMSEDEDFECDCTHCTMQIILDDIEKEYEKETHEERRLSPKSSDNSAASH